MPAKHFLTLKLWTNFVPFCSKFSAGFNYFNIRSLAFYIVCLFFFILTDCVISTNFVFSLVATIKVRVIVWSCYFLSVKPRTKC